MNVKKPGSDKLIEFLQGRCEKTERKEIEDRLAESPSLRLELEILGRYLKAGQAMKADSSNQELLKRQVLAAWSRQKNKTVLQPRMKSWALLRPAMSLGTIVILLVAALWIADKRSADESYIITLPSETVFDTGIADPGGKAEKIRISGRIGRNYLGINSLSRGYVQGGDEVSTGKNGLLRLHIGNRTELTLLPETSVRFHQIGTEVAPFLVEGTVSGNIEHDEENPVLLLAENVRIVDVGTRYSVRIGHDGKAEAYVQHGSIRIERAGQPSMLVQAGQSAGWDNIDKPTRLLGSSGLANIYEQIEKMEEEALAEKRSKKALSTKKVGKALDTGLKTNTAKTSWNRILESLEPSERKRVQIFYLNIERQMNDGYTKRAIASLRAFIDRQPGIESEKARYLLGESHYNLQEYENSLTAYHTYLLLFPQGTWKELAKARRNELREMIRD